MQHSVQPPWTTPAHGQVALTCCCARRCCAATGIDLQQLSIIKGKACWTVFVDALVLNDDGNVLDALSYAAK